MIRRPWYEEPLPRGPRRIPRFRNGGELIDAAIAAREARAEAFVWRVVTVATVLLLVVTLATL